ncbi:hypothetical protein Droror1_Dr00016076 [Drosera rotundifolia]
MEMIKSQFSIGNCRNRKGYKVLDQEVATKRRKIRVVKIKGKSPSTSSRFWRIKRVLKLRVIKAACRGGSPKTLWKRFKDGYINMMLRIAGGGGGVFQGKRIPKERRIPVKYKGASEFEARLVMEIYKSLGTSRGISEL